MGWITAQRGRIVRILSRRGVPARDAPDLAAGILASAARRVAVLAAMAPGQRSAWMRGAARRAAANYMRALPRNPASPGIDEDPPEIRRAPSPVSSAEEQLAAAALVALLSRATTPERWRILAAVAEGVAVRDLARETGEHEATLWTRLRAAREDMLAALRAIETGKRPRRRRRSRRLPRGPVPQHRRRSLPRRLPR